MIVDLIEVVLNNHMAPPAKGILYHDKEFSNKLSNTFKFNESFHSSFHGGKLIVVGDLTEKEIIRAERNSGVVSNRVLEIKVQAGLSALEDAMQAGYEDFKTIRNDPDLANLRVSEEFKPLLKKYDKSFINESAINAIKSLFGFNKNISGRYEAFWKELDGVKQP